MIAAVFSFTAAGFDSKSGSFHECFMSNFNSTSLSFKIFYFDSSVLYYLVEVARENGCSFDPSYCFQTDSTFIFLLSSFSFSMSWRLFLYRFL